MSSRGPLAGLRVIDLTDDLGRFGTKLLAEFGATVWRLRGTGARGSTGAPMDGGAAAYGGVLDWWFDAAKTRFDLDLDDESGIEAYRRLASAADLIIESQTPGRLATLGVDHDELRNANPSLVQVSLTPFGRTGPRAHWQSSDLVAGALGGVLSLTGTEDAPLNSWGWQNYNFAGYAAAICGLAGVRSAARTGSGQLIDVSLHEVMAGSIENLLMQYLYDDVLELATIAPRQGSLHWLGAYEVAPAAEGNVMITPTPKPQPLVEWMTECGIDEAARFLDRPVEELLEAMPDLMRTVKTFVATKPAGELFSEAQGRHVAFGEVQTVPQVAANPQFAHRGLYSDIELGSGEHVRGPWRLVRFSDTPIGPPESPPSSAPTVEDVLASIVDPGPGQAGDLAADIEEAGGNGAGAGAGADEDRSHLNGWDGVAKPLSGLRVLDLSWVLAGPFSTRLLGDLGADVIKVQTEERATLVNNPEYPYYAVWNRSKRSVTLDLKHDGAQAVVRRLVEASDVLVENYSSGVLDRLGLGWDQVHEWNPRLVYISMSGCGHDGPWSSIISYAPTIHALCGLTHLTNPEGRGDVGCGFSLNDHAAGYAAALSVLAALAAREQTGKGQHIDMAQLEIGAHLVGPAIVDHFHNGREATPAGNVDGLADHVPNSVHRCADGEYLAVTATSDEMWCRLATVIGDPSPSDDAERRRLRRDEIDRRLAAWCATHKAVDGAALLQEQGVAAGPVQNARDLVEDDPQLDARGYWLEAETGPFGVRRHDRFPALWDGGDLSPYRPAPAFLGEANFDVWGELVGLEIEDVAEGIADGLFG